jgi:hypothetical protein
MSELKNKHSIILSAAIFFGNKKLLEMLILPFVF